MLHRIPTGLRHRVDDVRAFDALAQRLLEDPEHGGVNEVDAVRTRISLARSPARDVVGEERS